MVISEFVKGPEGTVFCSKQFLLQLKTISGIKGQDSYLPD